MKSLRNLLVLLLATAVLSGCALMPDKWMRRSQAGNYVSSAEATAPAPLKLTLLVSGTAGVITPNDARVGYWVADGDTIRATFPAEAPNGEDWNFVWKKVGEELQPVSWNQARFGATGYALQRVQPTDRDMLF